MENNPLEIKFVEVVDIATCIPCLLLKGKPDNMDNRQSWIWERGGWGDTEGIYLMPIQTPELTKYDPYDYKDRTFKTVLLHAQQNWNTINDGDVIDVEFVLGEKSAPKESWQHYKVASAG